MTSASSPTAHLANAIDRPLSHPLTGGSRPTGIMKPNRAQLNLAATIYGLTLLAQTSDPSEDDWSQRVRGRMVARAEEQLARLGLGNFEVNTESQAVELAMKLKPTKK